MITRNDYVRMVAIETGFTQKDVKTILDAAQNVAYKAMAEQEEVKVFDGLTLSGVYKEATTARSPMDGSTVEVPAKTVPKAKFGVAAKRVVNGAE